MKANSELDIVRILDEVIENGMRMRFEESSNSNCYDIEGGSFDFMICKVFTNQKNKMDYIIKFYDEFGFFEPNQIKVEPSNEELYNKCEKVLSLAKSQDDLVYE